MVNKERNTLELILHCLCVLCYVMAVIPLLYVAWKLFMLIFGISEINHPFFSTFELIYSTLGWAVMWGLAGYSFGTALLFKTNDRKNGRG